MQGIGLDWIDLARWPPSLQQQKGDAEQQPAEARNQQRAQRLDPELARETLPQIEVEQQHVQSLDRGAHRGHHQSADGSDQQRQQNQARFMRANERPQPARRFKIAGRGDHSGGSVGSRKAPSATI